MGQEIVIERLEFQGHCGVSEAERLVPQAIAVDLTLRYPQGATSAHTDDLAAAVDYARVAQRVIETGTSRSFNLVETLADQLATVLLAEFAVDRVELWVRKVTPPMKAVQGSVGVRLTRSRESPAQGPAPASFLVDALPSLPGSRVLDVAAGSGRHTLYLASHGFSVHAVDRDEEALAALASEATRRGLGHVTTQQLDLEADPSRPPDFSDSVYDVVVVFFYLFRPLFPAILRALKPGGVLVYETFLVDNHVRYQHPRRREFCLAHNELLGLIPGMRVLHYDEGERLSGLPPTPAVTARLLARKESPHGAD